MHTKICLTVLLFCGSLNAQFVIVNNASFRTDQPLAAGSWAAAFPTVAGTLTSSTFSGVTATTSPTFPLPKTLGGVRVTVDGVDAPVYDVRSSQITFLIPYAAAPGLRPVQITTGSGTLNGSIRVITSAPALFLKDAQVPPRGAIRNQDGFTENTSSTPTKRGDIISIYGTGPGALSQQVQDGSAAGSTPVVTTRSTPQVFIAGVEAQVQFSGLNPDAPGLWQVNAFVPNLSFVTGRVPIRIFMDGVDSNEVTVFVQ